MSEDEKERPGIFPFPPVIYLVPLLLGLVIQFFLPVRLLPVGGLQFAIGLPIIGISIVVLISAALTLVRAGTALDPEKVTTKIVTHGPYRFTRNPLYLFLAIIYVGITISVNTIWPLFFLPVSLVLISLVMRQEERYLDGKFGQEYLDYKARVRRWM